MPLLIHSMGEFREIIISALQELRPASIVEVGSEHGGSTRVLLNYTIENNAHLTVVDPKPSPGFFDLLAQSSSRHLTHISETSINALPHIPPADVYFLDGDHNYWTVSQELRSIFTTCKQPPWIFLHDVGLPWGDRDLYYAPSTIPPEGLHPYTFEDGVNSENELVSRGGFRGEGSFAIAKHKGGPKNGVRKAVEDFIFLRPDLSFNFITPIFGLGIITPINDTEKALELLAPYRNELVEKMERNRLELYLKVLELQDRLNKSPLRRLAKRLRGKHSAK